MAAESLFSLILFWTGFLSVLRFGESLECVMREGSPPCVCDMSDGSGSIDLTPLGSKSGTAYFENIRSQFSYNPCYDFTFNKCVGDVATCQHVGHGTVIGRQSKAQFVVRGTNPLNISLNYDGGQPDPRHGDQIRVSNFTLVCDPSKEAEAVEIAENPRDTFNFKLTSKYCCLIPSPTSPPKPPSPEDHKISLGTILDICLACVLLLYFIVGALFFRFRRGATGADVIPNKEFWTSLPGLIKDGAVFAVRPCRRGSKDYETLN